MTYLRCWCCSEPAHREVDGLMLCEGCEYMMSPARERERRREEDCARYRAQEERARMRLLAGGERRRRPRKGA